MTTLQLVDAPLPWQRARSRHDDRSPRLAPAFAPTSRSTSLGKLFDSTWQAESPVQLAELRRVCSAFVRTLRRDGQTAEQVLVALKHEIADGGALHQTPSLFMETSAGGDHGRERAYERLFQWFLEAYFDL